MKYIQKRLHNDPKIIRFQQQSCDWDNQDLALKREVARILKEEQSHKCAYCENTLSNFPNQSGKSYTHIEHIKPRECYKAYHFNYDNIVISCGNYDDNGVVVDHCGMKKADYDPIQGFVSPLDTNCSSQFKYSFNGEMLASNGSPPAIQTINVLNLNHPTLVQARKAIFDQYIKYSMNKATIMKLLQNLSEDKDFYSARKYILDKLK